MFVKGDVMKKYLLALIGILIVIFLYRDGFCFKKMRYFHGQMLDKTYETMILERIDEDKKARRLFLLSQGKNESEISKILTSLETQYLKERKKIFQYCENKTEYCHTIRKSQILAFDWINVEINVKYFFDKESREFFNQIPYVKTKYGVEEKLHLVKLTGINSVSFNKACTLSNIRGNKTIAMGELDHSYVVDSDTVYINFTTIENGHVTIGTIQGSNDKKIYVKFTEINIIN